MINPSSCTSILIGKKASGDGSILIGRNEDSKAAWPKHFVVHPHEEYQEPQVFESKDTGLKLTLPKSWAKYTATPEWTPTYGLFEEAGINEYGVAMSATESAYANPRVLGFDPLVPAGIAEEAMVTVVLPFVKSAKAGVLRLGKLVETYGTSESNGILFADHQEAWYLETGSGHQWVAQRIPDDSYAVVANQLAIETIDFESADFLFAPTIREFCLSHQLWQKDTDFNFRQIFGTDDASDRVYNTPRVWDGQRYLSPARVRDPKERLPFIQKANRPLYLEDAIHVLSSHFNETEYDPASALDTPVQHQFRPISLAKTQEAHILQMRPTSAAGVGDIHWLAMGVAAESLFVPFFAGLTKTPPDYQTGVLQFDANSAYWQAKQLSVLIDSHFQQFMPSLITLQNKALSHFLNSIAKTDQALNGAKDAPTAAEICTQASFANSQYAKTAIANLYSELLIKACNLSPLNFKTDANL